MKSYSMFTSIMHLSNTTLRPVVSSVALSQQKKAWWATRPVVGDQPTRPFPGVTQNSIIGVFPKVNLRAAAIGRIVTGARSVCMAALNLGIDQLIITVSSESEVKAITFINAYANKITVIVNIGN